MTSLAHRFLFAVAACAALAINLDAGIARQAPPPRDEAKEQRLAWFREAKYGMFIHWGLYAIPAGEWKGKRSLGLGEWIMNRSRDPGEASTSSSPRSSTR